MPLKERHIAQAVSFTRDIVEGDIRRVFGRINKQTAGDKFTVKVSQATGPVGNRGSYRIVLTMMKNSINFIHWKN